MFQVDSRMSVKTLRKEDLNCEKTIYEVKHMENKTFFVQFKLLVQALRCFKNILSKDKKEAEPDKDLFGLF